MVAITFDPAKREATLRERRIDFRDAEIVFAGRVRTFEDARVNYGETRFITFGLLASRMVVVVWTLRGENRHVISMRKTNDREQARYLHELE